MTLKERRRNERFLASSTLKKRMPRKSAHSSREPRPDDCPIQILGSDGNVITVPSSILTQAGINIRDSEELTHQQVTNVLSLMNADQSESHQSTSADERTRKRSHSLDMNRSEQNSQQATFTINGTDDGGLELIDSTTGRHFYLSPSQLEENGITIENGELSHDELTQIIQMTVNMGQGEGNERDGETGIEERRNLPPAKRSKEGYQKAGASRANTLGHQVEFRRPSGSADVGDKVQFKRAGKVQEAIVRYIRSQAGYKVQFDDGHFEWIDEGDLINQSDHRDHQSTSGTSHQGINRAHKMNEKDEANFCCPICTRKVHQKRPSYIVIRIPACDDCSREKVMVLDEENE